MEITGYKVYFDGEKFVAEDERSKVQALPAYSLTHWSDTKAHADKAAKNDNAHLKAEEANMVDDKDFIIRKCKDCGEYFMVTKSEYDWYKEKDFAIPRRCDTCRTKRRKEAKTKNAT